MFAIEQFSYRNRLRSIHPLEKFCFAIFTLFISLLIDRPLLSILIIALMSGITILAAGVPLRRFFKFLLAPFSFLCIGVLAVVITVGNDPSSAIFSFSVGKNWILISSESLTLGLSVFLRALGSVCCMYFLVLSTPMIEIVFILKKLKIPKLFIEIFSLVYSSIYILLDMASRITLSQRARQGFSNMRNSYNSLALLISTIFLKTYAHSRLVHTALASRGYDGELDVLEPVYKFSRVNWVIIGVIEIGLLGVALLGGMIGV